MWKEFFRKNGEKLKYEYNKVIVDRKTKFQHVEILETNTFGRALFLDDSPQSAESDEFIYHECLIHPAILLCSKPRKVFVAGGGEGAVLREILKQKGIEEIVLVDIDEELVNISKKYLTKWHRGAFENKRVKPYYQDARAYLEESDESFDVIISDLTAPKSENPACYLFTKEFFELVRSKLTPKGVFVTQAQCINNNNLYPFVYMHTTLSNVFKTVRPYHAMVPFFADDWGFILATDSEKTIDIGKEIKTRIDEELKHYDAETHRAMFSLPLYLRCALESNKKIITDANPFYYDKLSENEI